MPPTLATASIQGVGLLLSMDQRSAWPAAFRTDKRSGIKAKLSPRSGSALTSAHSVCILCFVNCDLDMFHCICWRPYHVECTGSLLTSEVKRHRARLVLGWGTAREDLRVLSAFAAGHPPASSLRPQPVLSRPASLVCSLVCSSEKKKTARRDLRGGTPPHTRAPVASARPRVLPDPAPPPAPPPLPSSPKRPGSFLGAAPSFREASPSPPQAPPSHPRGPPSPATLSLPIAA